MRRIRLATVVLFLWALTVAPVASAQGASDADLREIKQYRLTMPKMTAFYAATKSLRKLAATEPKACAAVEPSEGDEKKVPVGPMSGSFGSTPYREHSRPPYRQLPR